VAKFGKDTRVKFVGGELHIHTTGDDKVYRALGDIIKKTDDLRIPFERFKPVWMDDIADTFAANGTPVPWPDLSPAYAARMHGGDTTPTLRLTDTLYDSLTSQTGDTIWQVGPKTIKFGTRVPYFIFHQEGTATMPQRAPLVLSPYAAQQLVQLIINYISDEAPL